MTGLDFLLSVLFLTATGLAVAGHRQYPQLQRKYKLLQQRYDKAKSQLNSLWTDNSR